MKPAKTALRSPAAAFTLIELLTVIAIIGILAAIIIPTVGKVRDSARTAHCMSNLRSLHSAAIMAIEDRKGKMLDRDQWRSTSSDKSGLGIASYLTLPKGTTGPDNWPANLPSPLRCEAAYRIRSSTEPYTRTYGINQWACSTFDDGVAPPSTLPTVQNLTGVANPSQMALFMDGAVNMTTSNSYWKYIRPQHIDGNSSNPPINYAHNDSANVVFIDGHIRRIPHSVMSTENNVPTSPFWGNPKTN
jgi:general secretion pathway protein G